MQYEPLTIYTDYCDYRHSYKQWEKLKKKESGHGKDFEEILKNKTREIQKSEERKIQ